MIKIICEIFLKKKLQEEKRKIKDRKRMEYEKARLLPQWKTNPRMEFKCSSIKKLTAMEITD